MKFAPVTTLNNYLICSKYEEKLDEKDPLYHMKDVGKKETDVYVVHLASKDDPTLKSDDMVLVETNMIRKYPNSDKLCVVPRHAIICVVEKEKAKVVDDKEPKTEKEKEFEEAIKEFNKALFPKHEPLVMVDRNVRFR